MPLFFQKMIIDGSAWAYAKVHVRVRDGHEAYLSVQHQATGTAANTLKKLYTTKLRMPSITGFYLSQILVSCSHMTCQLYNVHYISIDIIY